MLVYHDTVDFTANNGKRDLFEQLVSLNNATPLTHKSSFVQALTAG